MPSAILQPCSQPGCRALVQSGRCEQHRVQQQRAYAEQRGSSTERGYDGAWRKVRAVKLARNPLCEDCYDIGRVRVADDVHHVRKVSERPELRLYLSNLR